MNRTFKILLVISSLLAIAGSLVFAARPTQTSGLPTVPQQTVTPTLAPLKMNAQTQPTVEAITRKIELKTQLQKDVSYEIKESTVERGESLWSIAQQFDLQPETILWAMSG